MLPTVYLAGPITGETIAGANDWRQVIAEDLADIGIRALNPLRGKDYLHALIGDGIYDRTYPDDHPMSAGHGIYRRDSWDVRRCDMLLVNFVGATQVSIGTVMEIAWAEAAGKYVLVAMEADNVHQYPMIIEAASLIVPTLKEALALVPVMLGV